MHPGADGIPAEVLVELQIEPFEVKSNHVLDFDHAAAEKNRVSILSARRRQDLNLRSETETDYNDTQFESVALTTRPQRLGNVASLTDMAYCVCNWRNESVETLLCSCSARHCRNLRVYPDEH